MPDRTIEHIREKIAEANLPDGRKDKLFDLVDELKEELDKIAGEHHDDAVYRKTCRGTFSGGDR